MEASDYVCDCQLYVPIATFWTEGLHTLHPFILEIVFNIMLTFYIIYDFVGLTP